MAKENNYDVRRISYRKADGTSSERDIISFGEPRDTMLALEVTLLTPQNREELQAFLRTQRAALADKMRELNSEFKSFKPGMITYIDGPQ